MGNSSSTSSTISRSVRAFSSLLDSGDDGSMSAQNRDDETPSGAAMEDDPHVTPTVASARVAVGEDQDFGAGSDENQKIDDGTPQLDDSMLPSSTTSPSIPSLLPSLRRLVSPQRKRPLPPGSQSGNSKARRGKSAWYQSLDPSFPLELALENQSGTVTMTRSRANGGHVDVASLELSSPSSRDEMISNLTQDLQKSEPLIGHLAERRGRGGQKNAAIVLLDQVVGDRRHDSLRGWMQMAVHHPFENSYEPWLISVAVINSFDNCAVIFEPGSSTGTYERLCATQPSDKWKHQHLFMSAASTFSGRNEALYLIEANQHRQGDRRYGPEVLTHLLRQINAICSKDPKLSVFVLVNDSSAKGDSFDAKLRSLANLQISSRPHESTTSFIRKISSNVSGVPFNVHDYFHSYEACLATRSLEQNICAQKLLTSLHRVQLVEATPNFLRISSYLSVFDPHTLKAILRTYRSMVASRKKKERKALSDVSLPSDSFRRLAEEVFGGLFEKRKESDANLRAKPAFADGRLVEAHDSCAFDGSDDGITAPECGYQGDGSLSRRPSLSIFESSSSSSSSSATQLLGVPVSFMSFVRCAAQTGVLLEKLNCIEGSRFVFSLPPYNLDTLTVTNGQPVIVTVSTVGEERTTQCSCTASQLAHLRAQSDPAVSNWDKVCWHNHALDDLKLREHLCQRPVTVCNSSTGRPDGDVVCVIGIKFRSGESQQGVVPLRVYVYVDLVTAPRGPGNMRPAVVTFRRLPVPCNGYAFGASCDSCSSGHKSEKGVKNQSRCQHVQKSISATESEDDLSTELAALKRLFDFEPPKVEGRDVYDPVSQRWKFPSLDREIYLRREKSPVPVPTLKETPAGMGGANDPSALRSALSFDVLRGVQVPTCLVVHSLAKVPCLASCGGQLRVSRHEHGCSMCTMCSAMTAGNAFSSTCGGCEIVLCPECTGHAATVSGVLNEEKFTSSFPEFSHLPSPLAITPALLQKVRNVGEKNTSGVVPLNFMPPLPSLMEGTAHDCTFDETGYTFSRNCTVYGASFSQEARVFNLNCNEGHQGCKIEFAGPDRGVFQFSTKTSFRTDVFELFWGIQRSTRGSSASSFVDLMEGIYSRNGSGGFVSEPTFRDAFFAYFSMFDIDFNTRCLTCPVVKDPETGVLATTCKVIGYDAVTLMSKRDKSPYNFNAPSGDGEVDYNCKDERTYNRLFFPGSENSAIGMIRKDMAYLCSLVLASVKSTDAAEAAALTKLGTLCARIRAEPRIEAFESPAALLVAAIKGPRTVLIRCLATVFLCMCNLQGEVLQISNVEEASFLAQALRREKDGTLSALFLAQKRGENIRSSIVELLCASVVRPSGQADDEVLRLRDDMKIFFGAIIKETAGALRNARNAGLLPPIPPEERKPANPSETGLMLNFTRGGQQLRKVPRWEEPHKRSRKASAGICAKKQFELKNRHGKFMNKTRAILNFVCLHSRQSMGFVTLQEHEGRSHGVLAMYLFLPYLARFVVCDTGCQSASWAHTHLKYFFRRWKFVVDRFHHFPHKCALVTKAEEFPIMQGKNDSLVEQLHRYQRSLGLTMLNMSQDRATFLLQLLNYHMFCELADRAGIPKEQRAWPDPSTVPLASKHEDEVDDADFGYGEAGPAEVTEEVQKEESGTEGEEDEESSEGDDGKVDSDIEDDYAEDYEGQIDEDFDAADANGEVIDFAPAVDDEPTHSVALLERGAFPPRTTLLLPPPTSPPPPPPTQSDTSPGNLWRDLTPTENAMVNTSWVHEATSMARVCDGSSKAPLLGKHFARLAGRAEDSRNAGYLQDEILNRYVELLMERHKRTTMEVPEGDRPLPIHCFSSFFFQKIFDSEPSSVENVSRWRNKITSTGKNAFELGKLIIPVNIEDEHWALAIAYVQDRKFQYLDSMGRGGEKYLRALRDWFKQEAAYWTNRGRDMKELGDIDTWEVLGVPGGLPQQVDSSSCGVFVCYYANYITAGMVPHFQASRARTTLMRKRISLDLLNGAID